MKDFIELIKTLRESSRGKAILFFGFYFVFFFILILVLKFGGNRGLIDSSKYEKGVSYSFSLEELLKKNYSFSYEIMVDGNENIYTGKKLGEKQLFSYQNKNYYFDGNKFYIQDKESLEVENPYLFYDFLVEDNIVNLINASSYESQTSYESGKKVYTFLLSSNTINQLIKNVSSDFFEEPNKIVISVDENNVVESIHFLLDSYCQVNSLCEKSLDMKLYYSNYGKVKKLESIDY